LINIIFIVLIVNELLTQKENMDIIRKSSEFEYLHSFWIHQIKKGAWTHDLPSPSQQKQIIIENKWNKFPENDEKKLSWYLCEINSLKELENIEMSSEDISNENWLKKYNIWNGSFKLKDIAKESIKKQFFYDEKNNHLILLRNYHCWKNGELFGILDGDEKITLKNGGKKIIIFDGFGRLLPYLTLILGENKKFYPFQAYVFFVESFPKKVFI